MIKIKDIDIGDRKRVERSLENFMFGGKYNKNKKPQSLNWIIGIIRSSGVKPQTLNEIFGNLQNYAQDEEQKSRLELASKECRQQGLL